MEDELHIAGHGNRSVKRLEKLGLEVTSEEKRAISKNWRSDPNDFVYVIVERGEKQFENFCR